MSDADPVDITVRIKNKFSKQIETLKAELASIQDKIEADLEINDNGEIDWAKMELESLERLIEAILKLDTKGVAKAHAELDSLDGRVTDSTHIVDVHRDGDNFDPPLGSGMDFGDDSAFAESIGKIDSRNSRELGETALRNAIHSASGSRSIPSGVSPSGLTRQDFGVKLDRRMLSQDRLMNVDRLSNRDVDWNSPISKSPGEFNFGASPEDIFAATGTMWGDDRNVNFGTPDMDMGNMANRVVPSGGRTRSKKQLVGGLLKMGGRTLDSLNDSFDVLGEKVAGVFPTMRRWMNLIAALIPMLITLGAGALGVAGAFGAIGVAGASMLGLGMLGWGDSLKDSMEGAKEQIKQLKQELYSVFKPATEAFQPIVDRLFSTLPTRLEGLSDEMEGFTVFEGIMNDTINAFIGFLEKAVAASNDLHGPITAIAEAFMSGMNGGVSFFRKLIKYTYDNWEMFQKLVSVLVDIGVILFNLSEIVSKLMTAFAPLFNALAWVSGIINNEFVIGLLTALSTAFLLVKTLMGLAWIGSIIKGLASWTALWAAELGAAATFMSILTAGAAAVAGIAAIGGVVSSFNNAGSVPTGGSGPRSAGGMTGSRPATGSGGDTYIMQVDGNTRDEHMDQFKDMASNREYWNSSEEDARDTGGDK